MKIYANHKLRVQLCGSSEIWQLSTASVATFSPTRTKFTDDMHARLASTVAVCIS